MKRLLLVFAALLPLSACDRDPTGSDADIVLVQVMPDERTLAVGETLEMDLIVRDEEGEAPDAAALAKVAWSSDNLGVATVSPRGVVTGVAPGTATITAELGGKSGSVKVTVAAAPPACGTAGSLRSPEVGGSVVLGGVAAATVCLGGGAEYVAVPFHAGKLDAGLLNVQMTAQGVVAVVANSPSVAPALSPGGVRALDETFHERLRARAERQLARHVDEAIAAGRGGAGLRPSFALDLRSPTLGQQVQVNTAVEKSCDQPASGQTRTGRVMAITQRAIVLADVANPSGGLTDTDYAALAQGFDALVYPTVTANFGEPRDVDENGRVIIFYTRAVNELTPRGSTSYVGGFFHPRDLFPTRARDGLAACAGSNVAEMFYMLVPDPAGEVNGNVFSREMVLQTSLGTVAHEFQHLVNASRRLYVVGTTNWNEQTWLNEAMSHVAEEMMFYATSGGLGPRQNLGAQQLQSGQPLAAYRAYMDQNIRRYERFLQDPENQSPYDSAGADANDLPTRGAGWAFLRYAADRRGGSDGEFMRALVDGSTLGFANLQRVLGTDPRPWVRDWTVSVFTDDVVPTEARFQQPSWRFRTFFNPFPLVTRRISGATTVAPSLKSGSGAFVRFGVPAGGTGIITARQPDGQPLPSSVYVTIVRTK